MSKQSILIIEDERPILDILQYNLEKEGFEVITASDGQDGLRKAQNLHPDMVLLDLMLPVMDGIQICRELRGDPRTKDIAILMCTAKSEEVDEIVGFSMGADDYVTKPFKLKPLLSRIRAVLRRPKMEASNQDVVSTPRIKVDRINHTAVIDGDEIPLTPTEFKLLWTLAKNPGRPFRRNELMDICRGEDANALERTIDVHIRSLRQKMRDASNLVETIRGVGYRLKSE